MLQTLLHLFHFVQFVICWQFFLELNSKRLYQSPGKEKWSCCLVITLSTKREIRHFQKIVMHVQSCCLANLKPIAFLPFSLTSPSLLLYAKVPYYWLTSQNENYIPHLYCELEMPVNKQYANMNLARAINHCSPRTLINYKPTYSQFTFFRMTQRLSIVLDFVSSQQ